MKILIVVAHPDDAEISMGMKIQDHIAKGDEVFVHCLSQGGYFGDHCKPIRINECKRAAKILGITHYSFSDITDSDFAGERKVVRDEIKKLINSIEPDIYYTHYFDDLHLDHITCSKESLTMAKSIPTILYFRSPYSQNFKPNYFFSGNEAMQSKKLEAIKAFESQHISTLTNDMKLYASIAYLDYLPVPLIMNIKKVTQYDKLYVEQFYIERMINL